MIIKDEDDGDEGDDKELEEGQKTPEIDPKLSTGRYEYENLNEKIISVKYIWIFIISFLVRVNMNLDLKIAAIFSKFNKNTFELPQFLNNHNSKSLLRKLGKFILN